MSVVHIIDFSKVGKNSLNPINAKLRNFILEELEKARKNDNVQSVILTGGGKNFSAGADLTEFSNPDFADSITLVDVVNAIENFEKPVVAAISGNALGGGLEVALSCHYRVATKTAKLGLPEVQVGIIPGAGGTQRLPRLIAFDKALQMIVSGKPVTATQAMEMGMLDATTTNNNNLMEVATKWAEWAALMPLTDRRTGQLPVQGVANNDPSQARAICQKVASKLPPSDLGGEAVHCAIKAVQACSEMPYEEGMKVESEMIFHCLVSPQGRARQHVFFAIRKAQKPFQSSTNATTAPTSTTFVQKHPLMSDVANTDVGVIGAGTMGGGIAMVLLQAGYRSVFLVDVSKPALEKGTAFLRKTISTYVKRGKLSTQKGAKYQAALKPTQKMEDLSTCLLVVEAVIENMKIKKKIFSALDRITPPQAILLSNTSTLDIDQMASACSSARRTSFAGWHFFSPAHIMKLVEVVRGSETSNQTIALLQALTKKVGKTGVVVGNCYGFCGNRLLKSYGAEAVMLLTEGASVKMVDKSLLHFGMAMGPLAMSDLAGGDVGYNIRRELGYVRDPKTNQVGPNRPARYSELGDDMVAKLGRVGQKAGKGYYDYNPKVGKGFKPIHSEEVTEFIKKYVTGNKKDDWTSTEIMQRLVFPLVNEGFKCLEEGIVQYPSDIDVVYVFGYGWPVWRGGPMYWADHEIGLQELLAGLQKFSRQFPETDHYVPSKLLERCVEMDLMVEEYYQQGLHKKVTSRL